MKITDGGLKSKLVRQADLLGGEEAFVKAVRPRALLTLPFFDDGYISGNSPIALALGSSAIVKVLGQTGIFLLEGSLG